MQLLEIVEKLKDLRKKDIQVLKTIEQQLDRYEIIPLERLAKELGVKPKNVPRYTDPLLNLGLIDEKSPGYQGFTLNKAGRDLLALHNLGLKGKITKIGPQLDVGKEGDIYVAYLEDDARILKFYRMRRKTFQSMDKSRPYPVKNGGKKWFIASCKSAWREFQALKKLWDAGIKVPKPIERCWHVIEMGYFNGQELVKSKLTHPKEIFKEIIQEIVKTVESVGIIHGELSAYNILVNKKGEICLIDFPQYLPKEDSRASEYLEKDFNRLIYHFSQKYGISENKLWRIIGEILEEKDILAEEE